MQSALVGYGARAVTLEMLNLLSRSVSLGNRLSFHIQLRKQGSEQLNDPVSVTRRGSSATKPVF